MSTVVTGEPQVPAAEEADAIIAGATEAVDATTEDGPRRLPDPYRLIVALRAKPDAGPCDDADCATEHENYELAVLQDDRMDVDTTIAVLTSALKSVAEQAGYTVREGAGRGRLLDLLVGGLDTHLLTRAVVDEYAERYLAHVREEAAKASADSHQNAEAPAPEPANS